MTRKELTLPSIVDGDLNFGEFSKRPEYREVNRILIRELVSRLPENFRHVDVATGTGLVPQLIIEEAKKEGKTGEVIGIDPNVTSLNIARRNIRDQEGISVKLIEGMGQDLKRLLSGIIPPEGVDGVSILDALHEIRKDEDKIEVVGAMADILKPGGLFIFNSAFTTDGILSAPMDWGRLKLRVMALLGGKRDKQAQVMPIHPPGIYRQMIESTGLKVIGEAKQIVDLTIESLLAISKYPAFFRGALEDMQKQESVPDIKKSDAFIQAIKELTVPTLPRVWYQIIAQKPSIA